LSLQQVAAISDHNRLQSVRPTWRNRTAGSSRETYLTA